MSIQDMALPKQLEVLLRATLVDSALKNLTIFQDNRGDVIFKLRFGATDAIKHDAVNTAQHKRKSQSQINRDQLRSDRCRENIKNRHQSQTYREIERSDPLIALNTDTEHTGDCGITRSRARLISDIEQVRCEAVTPEPQLVSSLNPLAGEFDVTHLSPWDNSEVVNITDDALLTPCTCSVDTCITEEKARSDA